MIQSTAPNLHRATTLSRLHLLTHLRAPGAQSKEPERTERLLANPLALFPPVGSDAFESIAVTVLFKCRGDRKHVGYHLLKLTAQVKP